MQMMVDLRWVRWAWLFLRCTVMVTWLQIIEQVVWGGLVFMVGISTEFSGLSFAPALAYVIAQLSHFLLNNNNSRLAASVPFMLCRTCRGGDADISAQPCRRF